MAENKINTNGKNDKSVMSYLNCSGEEITMEKYKNIFSDTLDISCGISEIIETRLNHKPCGLTTEEAAFLQVMFAAQQRVVILLLELYPD